MIGLMILLFFGIYLAATLWVTRAAASWAKRNNRSPWRWGGLTAFVMYNLVFWDFIPTLVTHKYYCATEAGFWVYKTPEQWKAESPGVAETLTWKDLSDKYEAPGVSWGVVLNERFIEEVRNRKPIAGLSTEISEDRIVDSKTNEVLAKRISVGSGYGNIGTGGDGSWRVLKFWLSLDSCHPKTDELYHFANKIKKMGSKK